MASKKEDSELLKRLEKLIEAKQFEEARELAKQLSVRERLMRRLRHVTHKVVLHDDVGPFEIEVRRPDPAVLDVLFDLQIRMGELAAMGTEEARKKYVEYKDKLYRIVADLCVDPGLDYEFWKAGKGFAIDDLWLIIAQAIGGGPRIEEVKKFRTE